MRGATAVPTLGRLFQRAAEPETRRAVASALANTRSSAAVQYLGEGLDDPDFEVRLESAQGLAEIAGEAAWKPTRPSFEKDEGRYLQHWRRGSPDAEDSCLSACNTTCLRARMRWTGNPTELSARTACKEGAVRQSVPVATGRRAD